MSGSGGDGEILPIKQMHLDKRLIKIKNWTFINMWNLTYY